MIVKFVKNVLLWSYERGSWQYDVLCILILAFIFLTPSDWFHKPHPAPSPSVTNQKEAPPPGTLEKDKESGESKKREPWSK